ncbi:MAG: DNA polymerase III subunit delta' [Pseudomonadota bacterium]|nr:DNA polymerase III subunit delta' [Pseudomonadota bacterium]
MEKNIIEEFESDKGPHTPHPRKTKKLVGHKLVKETFLDSYRSGKMHHAWLIHGPKGVGKATLAWQIAKFLLDNQSPSNQKNKGLVSRRIEALSEPSIFLCRKQFDKSKKRFFQDISIDEVRKINHFFSLTNIASQWRVVIIDPIDDLSNSAANALLKVLEEPPKGGVFFLICNNKENIVPTITSRCRLLGCSFLKQPEFEEVLSGLRHFDNEKDNLISLFSLTNGSISKAMDFIFNNGFTLFKRILEVINFNNEMNRRKIWYLLDQNNHLGTQKEYHTFIKELILLALSRISKALVEKDMGKQMAEEKEIVELYNNYSEPYFPFAWLHSSLINDFEKAEKINLDPVTTILKAFLKIEKILLRFKMSNKKEA